jgi:hypothetical protein
MPQSPIFWRDKLPSFQFQNGRLFDDAFVRLWGDEPWQPDESDRKAAAELHVQLVSRITTQRLAYTAGVEAAALKSLHTFFEQARDITAAHLGCRIVDTLAWQVINTYVRPFTAKWHPQSERGALAALDATDVFRAELVGVQRALSCFDDLLIEIRDERPPPARPSSEQGGQEQNIADEMAKPLPWGIDPRLGGIAGDSAEAINAAERRAIETRRKHYKDKDKRKEKDQATNQKAESEKGPTKVQAANAGGESGEGEEKEREYAVGLALSGGGIRSATFSLGALVALARRNLLHQFDYISTVSGGGYLGAFLTTYLNAKDTPPASASASSAALAPGSAAVSASDDAPMPTIGLCRDELPFRRTEGEAEALRHIRQFSKYLATGSLWERTQMITAQLYGMVLNGLGVAYLGVFAALIELLLRAVFQVPRGWTYLMVFFGLVLALASIIVPLCLRFFRSFRSHADRWIAFPAVALLVLLAWKLMWWLHQLYHLGTTKPVIAYISLSTAALMTAAVVPLLASAVLGFFGRIYLPIRVVLTAFAAIAAPLFILGIELAVFHWITTEPIHIPFTDIEISRTCAVFSLIGAVVLATVLYFVVLDVNFTSLHRHYRKKLAEAYLIQPTAMQPTAVAPTTPQLAQRFDSNVSLRLSGAKHPRAPYHLINCALNVPGSRNQAMQGRLTDFFLVSQAFCGSPLTDYRPTTEWEELDPNLDVGTAMAISGAAAAPQMGLGTMRQASFWLALLNIRLSYWLRDPAKGKSRVATPTLHHLFAEMFGWANENGRFLNLSDGGHIENLGVYELLRRRCKFIVAVDGEQDPRMTFHALTTLQRLAYIDLGVKIDVNLDDLRLNKRGITRSHFSFCRIDYPHGTRDGKPLYGYLLYVKLSLTGNEGEFIRRFRLDHPSFPHDTTANQFFTEAQFEAYRSLGEHVGDKLFLPAVVGDKIASASDVDVENWFTEIGKNVLDFPPR